ncbi:MAG: hypothetical protein AVDCRST_MAG59-453, partial [uncultured Thermomicrobiales bacterium]
HHAGPDHRHVPLRGLSGPRLGHREGYRAADRFRARAVRRGPCHLPPGYGRVRPGQQQPIRRGATRPGRRQLRRPAGGVPRADDL